MTKESFDQNQFNDQFSIGKLNGINNIYVIPNNFNNRAITDYKNPTSIINNKAITGKSSLSTCPCEILIKCKLCVFNLENSFNELLAENPNNIFNFKNCPCARKNICPPCAPASLLHDLAYRKVK